MNRVVTQQMAQGRRVGDVVDGDEVEARFVETGAQQVAADAAESIDTDTYSHSSLTPGKVLFIFSDWP